MLKLGRREPVCHIELALTSRRGGRCPSYGQSKRLARLDDPGAGAQHASEFRRQCETALQKASEGLEGLVRDKAVPLLMGPVERDSRPL
jgi:hypothetical protein